VTSKPDFKVMVLLLLVFMQLTRDLFAIAKFLFGVMPPDPLYFSAEGTPPVHQSTSDPIVPILRNDHWHVHV